MTVPSYENPPAQFIYESSTIIFSGFIGKIFLSEYILYIYNVPITVDTQISVVPIF